MQTEAMRERQINIRLNEEESARADFLASHYGVNVAAVTRILWKREEERLRRGDAEQAAASPASPSRAGALLTPPAAEAFPPELLKAWATIGAALAPSLPAKKTAAPKKKAAKK